MAKKAAGRAPKKKAPRAAKKSVAKKSAPSKSRSAAKGKAAKPARQARKPRNQSLPGMEHVRYRDLDALCEGIGDARAAKNRAVTDEAGYVQDAIGAMQKHDITGYKHAGIGLVLTGGAVKLSVRVLKEGEAEGADIPADGDAPLQDAPELDPDAGDVLDED